jgi:cytochrome c553
MVIGGLVALTTLLGAASASAQIREAAPGAADDRAGSGFDAYDYEYCLSCHGGVGQGNPTLQAPALAGMESWYLRRQLLAFRAGWRGGHASDLAGMEMRAMATALQPWELDAVVDYVAALPAQTAVESVAGQDGSGASLYAACTACHGERAEGNPTLEAPALWYQQLTYLQRQMRHFRDGVRGSAAGDERGALMQAAARGLDDADIDALATYIRTLRP